MIDVHIQDEGYNFDLKMGSFAPVEVEEVIKLMQIHGFERLDEKFVYIRSYYDGTLNCFSIVVEEKKDCENE